MLKPDEILKPGRSTTPRSLLRRNEPDNAPTKNLLHIYGGCRTVRRTGNTVSDSNSPPSPVSFSPPPWSEPSSLAWPWMSRLVARLRAKITRFLSERDPLALSLTSCAKRKSANCSAETKKRVGVFRSLPVREGRGGLL